MQKIFDTVIAEMTGASASSFPSVLLAVSGGMDSMCMASLFRYSTVGMKLAIAHMNFSLRGDDSDADQALVEEMAGKWNVPVYVRKVDTLAYARDNMCSMEMAARDLRYSWFSELVSEHGFDYVAVAHNANDSVETLFLNLARGTGLKGLSGIRPVNGKIIRPLLQFTRKQISDHVAYNGIPYRDDRTNFESDIPRNRIRNIVFPEMQKINSSFIRTVSRDIVFFTQASSVLDDIYGKKRSGFVSELPDGSVRVSLSGVGEDGHSGYWLYRILSEYSFNASQIISIGDHISSQSGKEFFSRTHYLLKDRDQLIIYPLDVYRRYVSETDVSVDSLPYEHVLPDGRKVRILSADSFSCMDEVRSCGNDVHAVSLSGISFPMKIRKWRSGDRIVPLGMKGSRKVSDLLTDMKLDRLSKRGVEILVNTVDGKEETVAVLGIRTDGRYRVVKEDFLK